jgi:hypothetical protein
MQKEATVRSPIRWSILLISVLALVAPAMPASGDHGTNPSQNIQALGHSPHPASIDDPAPDVHINSDLAFWGDIAFNGNYNGWRTIDISNPNNPVELDWYNECNASQGDIVVWGDILVRAWNSKVAGRFCGGQAVPDTFEGVHVFDISNLTNPQLRASVDMPCGSHTLTLAGIEGGNLIVYSNNSSSAGCDGGDPDGDFMDILSIPLNNPAGATLLRREPLEGPVRGGPGAPGTFIAAGCHDVGVIRLDVNKAACASADIINVFDIGANSTPGGSLSDPAPLFTITEPGVGTTVAEAGTNAGRWHSAAWSWDGEVILGGWEPGGGGEAECQATDADTQKSMFFYNGDTGAKLGQWVLPRAQGADENCTIHNYNVVPMRNDRHIVVGGHYQAGTWAVDFTNPASPQVLAYSDPASLGPGPHCPATTPPGCQLGGAWSSYWYNDSVYESEIQAGLNVYRVTHPALAPGQTINLPFLNPQTQMLPTQRCKGAVATHIGTNGNDEILGSSGDDVIVGLGGKDRIKARGGDDLVCAGGGRDRVRAGNGDDRAFGQGAKDRLLGQGAEDALRGGGGKDIIKGGSGRDELFGQGANDQVRGQGGADALNGGGGRDLCNGGAGQDTATKCERVQLVP